MDVLAFWETIFLYIWEYYILQASFILFGKMYGTQISSCTGKWLMYGDEMSKMSSQYRLLRTQTHTNTRQTRTRNECRLQEGETVVELSSRKSCDVFFCHIHDVQCFSPRAPLLLLLLLLLIYETFQTVEEEGKSMSDVHVNYQNQTGP